MYVDFVSRSRNAEGWSAAGFFSSLYSFCPVQHAVYFVRTDLFVSAAANYRTFSSAREITFIKCLLYSSRSNEICIFFIFFYFAVPVDYRCLHTAVLTLAYKHRGINVRRWRFFFFSRHKAEIKCQMDIGQWHGLWRLPRLEDKFNFSKITDIRFRMIILRYVLFRIARKLAKLFPV